MSTLWVISMIRLGFIEDYGGRDSLVIKWTQFLGILGRKLSDSLVLLLLCKRMHDVLD